MRQCPNKPQSPGPSLDWTIRAATSEAVSVDLPSGCGYTLTDGVIIGPAIRPVGSALVVAALDALASAGSLSQARPTLGIGLLRAQPARQPVLAGRKASSAAAAPLGPALPCQVR